jgi:hypothetical protein
MAHFAEIDETNTVLRVLVVSNDITIIDGVEDEQRGIDFLNDLLPESGTWLQTSYNASRRGQFAGPGSTYLPERDLFVASTTAPFPSWTLGDQGLWVYPESAGDPPEGYFWDEDTLSWVQPEAPFPSWVDWQDGAWQPPVPYPGPDDGTPLVPGVDTFYDWDEDTTSWVVLVPEE